MFRESRPACLEPYWRVFESRANRANISLFTNLSLTVMVIRRAIGHFRCLLCRKANHR